MHSMTRADVVARLRKQQGDRTQQDFAKFLGISPPHLSEIYRGTRSPGPKLLKRLGLKRLTIAEYVSKR